MDKNKVGEFHFVTESYLMDFRGRITIPMIGTYLLHAASCHAADRGKYMEHLLDLFDISMFRDKEIRRFEIAYQSEGKYGMELSLHKKEVVPDMYSMSICKDGKAISRAAVTWI